MLHRKMLSSDNVNSYKYYRNIMSKQMSKKGRGTPTQPGNGETNGISKDNCLSVNYGHNLPQKALQAQTNTQTDPTKTPLPPNSIKIKNNTAHPIGGSVRIPATYQSKAQRSKTISKSRESLGGANLTSTPEFLNRQSILVADHKGRVNTISAALVRPDELESNSGRSVMDRGGYSKSFHWGGEF